MSNSSSGTVEPNVLKRTLTLRHLIIYGMVTMAPLAPWQVYGMVAQNSFNMVPLVYVIGILLMFFTACSYAQMSKEFPNAGSIYTYVSKGINPHVGFVAGWTLLSDYILAPALLYLFAGIWMSGITPEIPSIVWSLFFLIFNTAINIRGIETNAKVNLVLFWLQIVSLLVFIGFAIKFTFVDGLGVAGFSLAPFYQAEHIDWNFIATAVSIVVLGFLGFDGISTLAEEAKDPKKNVGKASVLALVITGLIFLVQSYMAALVHPNYTDLDPDMAFFDIAKEVGGTAFYVVMIIVNVLAVGIAVTLNVQSSVSRILFAMSRDRVIPGASILGKIHPRFQTPVNAILFSSVVALIVSSTLSLETILLFINFGAVTSFMVLNLTVVYYFFVRKGERDGKSIIFYLLFPLIGFSVCAFVWTGFDMATYIAGFSWIAVGAIVGFIKSKGYKENSPTLKDM